MSGEVFDLDALGVRGILGVEFGFIFVHGEDRATGFNGAEDAAEFVKKRRLRKGALRGGLIPG